MKVTIITATYNNVATIADTMRSVAMQTYTNIEHLVIDGGSTDGTLQVIETLKQPFTKVISEPDGGMYFAINKGLKMATGQIIGLLHSDDEFFAPDTLQNIVNSFKSEQPGLLYANGLFVNAQNTQKVVRNWISGNFKPSKLWFGWVPLHTTMYFSADALKQLGYYDTRYRIASDYEYTLRALCFEGLKIDYHDAYVVRMKMGGKSTTLKNQYKKSKEDFTIMWRYKLPAPFTLAFKILQKIPQFLRKG